jgi:hypothetical protein
MSLSSGGKPITALRLMPNAGGTRTGVVIFWSPSGVYENRLMDIQSTLGRLHIRICFVVFDVLLHFSHTHPSISSSFNVFIMHSSRVEDAISTFKRVNGSKDTLLSPQHLHCT